MKVEWRHFRVNGEILLLMQLIWLLGLIHWLGFIMGVFLLSGWFMWRYSKVKISWPNITKDSILVLFGNIHFRKKVWILLGYKLILDVALGWVALNTGSGMAISLLALAHIIVDSLLLLDSSIFLERNYYVLEYSRFLAIIVNFLVYVSSLVAIYFLYTWGLPEYVIVGLAVSLTVLIYSFYVLSYLSHHVSIIGALLQTLAMGIIMYGGVSNWFIAKPLLWALPLVVYSYSLIITDIVFHHQMRQRSFWETTGVLALAVALLFI